MGSVLKTIVGLVLVIVIGSYIIDTIPVSNALQTGQKGTDPLVASARAVKQEVEVLTDKAHQGVYSKAVKSGLKKAADTLYKFVDSNEQPTKASSKESSL
jgi:uncharacterized protein YxeA